MRGQPQALLLIARRRSELSESQALATRPQRASRHLSRDARSSHSAILTAAVSERNVLVVRGMWEAFLRNDFEASLSAFDPDVEWDGTNLPDGTVSRGLDAVLEHVTKWAEVWETWDVELEKVIDAGDDRVIAFIRERG